VDAKLLYWCAALVNLGVILVCAAVGVRYARRGHLRVHQRLMLTASALVGLFLATYLAKVAFLGREDRSLWTAADYAVLYVHESCVAVMLLAGGLAVWRARGFRAQLGARFERPPGGLAGAAAHRRAGWIAVWGAASAFATAAGVLAGMFQRAGGG
jgi:uncharacterized membrane protein YozB (DUF420 family)